MAIFETEREKEEKNLRRRKIAAIIIALIIIYIILNLIRVNLASEKKEFETSPYLFSVEYETEEPDIIGGCTEKEYEWDYQWLGWNNDREGYVSPNFWMVNLDNRSGEFSVEFAFFDNSVYPYEQFHSRPYETVEEILPWELASMHSIEMKKHFIPGEEAIITSYTPKISSGAVYWAYANVDVPKYEVCNYTIENITIKKNITTIAYKTERKDSSTKDSVTLWQMLVGFVVKD